MRALLSVRTLPTRLAVRLSASDDGGMATAEYAIGTVAACGFGGVLWKVVENPAVLGAMKDLVLKALELTFN